MSYKFRKQRFCHLETSGRDRKRSLFWITPPATVTPSADAQAGPGREHNEPCLSAATRTA